LKVDRDVPDARRQRVISQQVLQQQHMREQLRQRRWRGYQGLIQPRMHQRTSQHAGEQCHDVRLHQAPVAPPDERARLLEHSGAVGRQSARREESAHHQKHLHGHASIFVQPVEQ
jgi:hypothetical protein